MDATQNETTYAMRFGGIARLYGQDALSRLRAARVMVIGIGGVGSWVVEGLARSGVGAIDLVDLDDICVTNTNRQLHALSDTVGQPKVEAMASRVAGIHPDCEVIAHHQFFTEKTADALLVPELTYVVDAIDGARNKCLLITRCRDLGLPLLTVGGAGGRRDPTQVRVDDLSRTSGDRLLHRVRKTLRQKHNFPRRGRFGVACVFSDEPPFFPTADGSVCTQKAEASSLRLDCASGFGTASFVTGAFGLLAAGTVVTALARGLASDDSAANEPADRQRGE